MDLALRAAPTDAEVLSAAALGDMGDGRPGLGAGQAGAGPGDRPALLHHALQPVPGLQLPRTCLRTARRRLQPHCWCARVTSTRSSGSPSRAFHRERWTRPGRVSDLPSSRAFPRRASRRTSRDSRRPPGCSTTASGSWCSGSHRRPSTTTGPSGASRWAWPTGSTASPPGHEPTPTRRWRHRNRRQRVLPRTRSCRCSMGWRWRWPGSRRRRGHSWRRHSPLNPSAATQFNYILLNGARIETVLGNKDRAAEYLEEIRKKGGFLTPQFLSVDPTFASLKGNPEVREAAGEVGVGGVRTKLGRITLQRFVIVPRSFRGFFQCSSGLVHGSFRRARWRRRP